MTNICVTIRAMNCDKRRITRYSMRLGTLCKNHKLDQMKNDRATQTPYLPPSIIFAVVCQAVGQCIDAATKLKLGNHTENSDK